MAEGNPQKVMVIAAHPDDADLTSGGTVAVWAKEGKEITYLICTNGNKGTSDPSMTPERLTATRMVEQREAAKMLGVGHVEFLGYDDGELFPTLALRRDICRAIRRFKPDIAIVSDPTMRFIGNEYINHPDHLAAGEAALAAIFPSARDRLYFPELLKDGLAPHKVTEVYLLDSSHPDNWIDIEQTIDLKIAAVLAHKSQFPDAAMVEQWLKGWGRQMAEGQGMVYAEAYRRMVLM